LNIRLTPLAKLIIFTFIAVLFLDACSCKTCGLGTDLEVPESVFYKTDSLIIDRVGETFFKNYVHADYLNSQRIEEGYKVRYKFKMIEYDFVDEEILILTNSEGQPTIDLSKVGIPKCRSEINGCEFIVDKERAIEIGVENNLPEGIKEWAIEFRWSSVVNRYIWHIISTTSESGSDNTYKASGEELMIDPTNSKVLKRRGWSIL
jgi:hypothetical protein